jgi:RND family efflux transporter MFP subunit
MPKIAGRTALFSLAARLRLSAILIVIVAGFLGCSRHASAPTETAVNGAVAEPVPVPVTVAAVELRPVQRRVSVVGTLFGFERITVTPKVEGRVQALHFDVGDRVPPGATLMELDATDYQLAVDEARRALEQELSRLDLTESPPDDFDIEQLPSIESAHLKLDNAVRLFERQKTLLAANVAAKQNYEQAETDYRVADADLRQARLDARTTLATVRHRESVLKLAEQNLTETLVKAPTLSGAAAGGASGDFVVAQRLVSIGEMIRAFPSTPVYELVQDDVLKLMVMVPEHYLAQVQIGLTVEVQVEAYPGEVFTATVARINPTIDRQSRTFGVEAHVANPDHRLRDGGFAKADVIVSTADNAVTVPLESVTRFAGVSKVFRVQDGIAEEVEITVGTQGPGWLEAIGGLRAGDVVVTSGQSQLANGTHVQVRAQAERSARRE